MAAPASLSNRIDTVLDAALAEQRIVGAVAMIAREGVLVDERAVGLADREAKRPMQLDSLLRLSSITKPIVTAAALAVIARGELALDDEIDKWLPDFRPHLHDGSTPTIT